VRKHNVDMENAETIEKWMCSVLETLPTLNIDPQEDYLNLVEDQDSRSYNRNKPFQATIKVCYSGQSYL